MAETTGTLVTMWLPLDEEAALDVMAELAGSDRAAVVRVALRRVLGAHPDDIRAGIAELPPDGRRSGPRATSAHDKIVSILDAAVSPGLSEAESPRRARSTGRT